MAQSEDIILRTIYEDGDAINGINKVIGSINKLESEFESLQKETADVNKAIGKDLVDANTKAEKSIDNVAKKTIQANKSLDDQKKAIQETAGAILRSGESAAKFAALMERVEKVKLTGAKSDVQDLEKEFNELLQTVKLTDDQMITLENNIEGVAAEIAGLDQNQIQKLSDEAGQLNNEFITAKSELRQLTNLINSGQLKGDELKTAELRAAELTDTIGDVRNKIKLLASDTRNLDLLVEGVTAMGAGFQIVEGAAALYGDESEELQETLIRLNAVMAIANGLQQAGTILTTKGGLATQIATGFQKAYTLAIGQGSTAMKIFRGALIATGVGALVVGLGALIANFDKVKKVVTDLFPGLEKIGSVFAGLKESITSVFSDFGDVFASLFKGDFSEAYSQFKDIGANAREAFNDGFGANEAQKAKDIIAKDLEDLAKAQRKRADLLEASGKDVFQIRQNANANELAALRLKNADEQDIEDKAHEFRIEQAKREEKLRQERIKQVQQYTKAFKDATREILELSGEFEILSEQEKFDVIKKQTIDKFKELRAELIKTGEYLGKDFSKQLEQIDTLIKGVESREFVPASISKLSSVIEKEIEETKDLISKADFGTAKALEKDLEKIGQVVSENPVTIQAPKFAEGSEGEYTKEWEKIIEDIGPDLESILQDLFEDIFQLPPGTGAEFLAGASAIIGEFGNLLNEATDIELENIDKQLDKLSERREKLEDELEKELELQKEGLANNVGLKQQEVDGLIAEETRLLAEKEKLQRESQRRQLIAETVSQTASLITSSIDIIKGFSKIPIIGLGLGIAAVASLFGFFAATKAKAFQATKLHTGARSIDDHFGKTVPNGRSDIPGRGEGYKLIDSITGEDTNVRISGREMLLPENVTDSQKDFFDNLRSGKYNGIDIAGVLAMQKVNKKQIKEIRRDTVVIQNTKQLVPFYSERRKKWGAKLMDTKNTPEGVVWFDI